MKFTIAIAFFATTTVVAKTPKMTICNKLTIAENFLRELDSNGVPLWKIPTDTLLKIKSVIKTGTKAGCKKQNRMAKTATPIKCKKFFQRGRSVICQ